MPATNNLQVCSGAAAEASQIWPERWNNRKSVGRSLRAEFWDARNRRRDPKRPA
jgi:hypothetical protein